VDVHSRLDELTAMVESARAMPMSASCMVNRAEMLTAIEDLRAALPHDLQAAQRILDERSRVVEDGRHEAQRLIDTAAEERTRMLSEAQVVREASREAERVIERAGNDAARMRREIDDYVDAKLANFEIVLHKTLGAVERGREKISGRQVDELAALSDSDVEVEPLPG
jgi:cell division septum initiation protein DivIVA